MSIQAENEYKNAFFGNVGPSGYRLKNAEVTSYYNQEPIKSVLYRNPVQFSDVIAAIPTWLAENPTWISPHDPTEDDKPGFFVSTVKPVLSGLLGTTANSYGVDLSGVLNQGSSQTVVSPAPSSVSQESESDNTAALLVAAAILLMLE